MKLYYSTGSCSMSCHIALEEAGLHFEGVEVSWERKENVDVIERLNPLAVVPLLVNDKGATLDQNAAILEYVADQKPHAHLLPALGTWERAQAMSWLSFVAADLHKAFVPLFGASYMTKSVDAQNEIKAFARHNIAGYLKHVDTNLEGRDYLNGVQFTVADCYLFTVLGWCKWTEVDLKGYKNIQTYIQRVLKRPAVQKVAKIHDVLTEY